MSEITATEATSQIEDGALLLDVREPYEWSAGHAPNARHLPLGQLPASVNDLPKDSPIVVVCKAGGRSAQATDFLRQQGFDAVNLLGGMLSWEDSNLPVIDDSGAPGTVV